MGEKLERVYRTHRPMLDARLKAGAVMNQRGQRRGSFVFGDSLEPRDPGSGAENRKIKMLPIFWPVSFPSTNEMW